MKNLKDLFINELKDCYSAETQIINEMPKIIDSTTCSNLRELVNSIFMETQHHVGTLEKVFNEFSEKPSINECEATAGLIDEMYEAIDSFKDTPVINAAIASSLQKMKHYQIASYGCLAEWAKLLKVDSSSSLLESILDEKKEANDLLTELARKRCNIQALDNHESANSDFNDISNMKKVVSDI
jgi:ferritin-like metal-binding protein YciE